MSKYFSISVILFCFSVATIAQSNETRQNTITVLGSVELREVADEASFNFTIKGVGENLREAVEDAESKTKLLTDKLIFTGIKRKNISTSDFVSGENYGDKAFLSSKRDYRAIIVTQIKTDSLELIKDILFVVSEAKVEDISKITFSFKDELGLRRRARIEAGLKAKEKAEDIAKALGVTVGEVLSIEEIQIKQPEKNNRYNRYVQLYATGGYSSPYNPIDNCNSFNNADTYVDIDEVKGSGFFAQTVSITSQVKVTFQIK